MNQMVNKNVPSETASERLASCFSAKAPPACVAIEIIGFLSDLNLSESVAGPVERMRAARGVLIDCRKQ
jgi:hypothetical protein